jgi:hypothetical protein
MKRQWASFNTNKIIPKTLTRAIDEFDEDVVRPYAEIIAQLKTALGLARLALLAETDPILAVIDTAIAVVQGLLDTLLLDFGFHVLFVPVLRTNKDVPELNIEAEGLDEGPDGEPARDVPLSLKDPPVSEGAGGNWGFYTVFANSIEDEGDLNRPKYPDDFAVMSFTLITGASNVGEILKNLFYLMKLLQSFVQVPLDSNLLPVPQNFRVLTISPLTAADEINIGDDDNNIYAILKWDSPDLINMTELFLEDVELEILSTSVYMKRDTPFANYDVGDALESHEIARFDQTSLLQSTHISIGELDPNEVYYFAVGFNVEVVVSYEDDAGEQQTIVVPVEHYDVSNQLRIVLNERRSPASNLPGGEFPDWVSITAPLNIIPGLEDGLRTTIALLQILRDQIASPIAELDEFLEDLEEYSELWLRRLQDLSRTLQALSAALKALRVGFSIYGFYADEGGSDLLVSEMNSAFFDAATENRPPFTGGGDVVAGMVFAAAAPGPAVLRPLLELYRLLFGDDVFVKVENGKVIEDPKPPDTGLTGESNETDLSEAINTIMRITEDVERSTEELIAATDLVPPGETTEAEPVQLEVDPPCE